MKLQGTKFSIFMRPVLCSLSTAPMRFNLRFRCASWPVTAVNVLCLVTPIRRSILRRQSFKNLAPWFHRSTPHGFPLRIGSSGLKEVRTKAEVACCSQLPSLLETFRTRHPLCLTGGPTDHGVVSSNLLTLAVAVCTAEDCHTFLRDTLFVGSCGRTDLPGLIRVLFFCASDACCYACSAGSDPREMMSSLARQDRRASMHENDRCRVQCTG